MARRARRRQSIPWRPRSCSRWQWQGIAAGGRCCAVRSFENLYQYLYDAQFPEKLHRRAKKLQKFFARCCIFQFLALTLRQIKSKATDMTINFAQSAPQQSMAMAMDMMVMCMMDNRCAKLVV